MTFGCRSGRMARLRYVAETRAWRWSPGSHELLGLDPHVAPSATALRSAAVEEDRLKIDRLLDDRLNRAMGGTALIRLGPRPRGRWLALAVESPAQPGPPVIDLLIVDVTEDQETLLSAHAGEAVQRAVASRESIEQAKGALMFAYGLDAEAAFARLVWQSKLANVKVRDIAERVVTALAASPPASADSRKALDDVLRTAITGLGTATPTAVPRLAICAHRTGDATVVAVCGEVDLATAERLDRALSSAADELGPLEPLIVDLRSVTHLGSIGVDVLARHERRHARAGRTVGFAAQPGTLPALVLDVALPHLKIHPDPAAALAATGPAGQVLEGPPQDGS